MSVALNPDGADVHIYGQNGQKRDNWLLEVVPQSGSDGVVVWRNWLSGVQGADMQWDGGVKVENLLVSTGSASS